MLRNIWNATKYNADINEPKQKTVHVRTRQSGQSKTRTPLPKRDVQRPTLVRYVLPAWLLLLCTWAWAKQQKTPLNPTFNEANFAGFLQKSHRPNHMALALSKKCMVAAMIGTFILHVLKKPVWQRHHGTIFCSMWQQSYIQLKIYAVLATVYRRKRVPCLMMMRHASNVTFLHASRCHLCLVLVLLFLLSIKLASLEKKRYAVILRKKGKEGKKKKTACRYACTTHKMHQFHQKISCSRVVLVYPYPYDLLVIFVSYATEATEFSAFQADVTSSISTCYCCRTQLQAQKRETKSSRSCAQQA